MATCPKVNNSRICQFSPILLIIPHPTDNLVSSCKNSEKWRLYVVSLYRIIRSYSIFFVSDIASVRFRKLHCTACDVHIGSAPSSAHNMHEHPVLHVLLCTACRNFYGDGTFEQGQPTYLSLLSKKSSFPKSKSISKSFKFNIKKSLKNCQFYKHVSIVTKFSDSWLICQNANDDEKFLLKERLQMNFVNF